MLVEYMKSKPQLISGKFSFSFTYKDVENEWQLIADSLDSMPGGQKDWKGWRKAWQDFRSRTKVKLAKNRKEAQATGGGVPHLSTMTDVILDVIKKISVEGHNVPEWATGFTFSNAPSVSLYTNPDNVISKATVFANSQHTQNELPLEAAQCSNEAVVVVQEDKTSNTPSIATKGNNKPKKQMPKKSQTLYNSATAAMDFKEHSKHKNKVKEEYYKKKIVLLEEGVRLKAKKRTPDQLRKCWENMKSRRKKELAAEKMNRMATGGGSYKPPTDDEDAVVDDIFSSVDIELKDSLDSDTITMAGVPESKAHPDVSVAAEEESICMPLNACYEAKDYSDLPVEVLPTPKSIKTKTPYNSRGTAIETELETRLARTKRAIEQDEELHKLQVEEQKIKIKIALEILKQEQIKTTKLLE
ncbi:hypothetical protein RN001_005688 [Aquatica leii]|uniref:Regulatory protein zeste n=1 Tax=Aquatica leii TaxID=1421715 RepID=A0AAN7PCP8_9COLE|nr:hypothetical protein RN001_005688 [Aquatica leii]